jgi:hypothetical protein
MSAQDRSLTIPADCCPARVAEVLTQLQERVATATPADPLATDLTDGRPTALALQLAAAAALSLTRAGAFAGYAANAAQHLSPMADRQEA